MSEDHHVPLSEAMGNCIGWSDDLPIFEKAKACTKFECQVWVDRVACGPELVIGREPKQRYCPKCGSSYGLIYDSTEKSGNDT